MQEFELFGCDFGFKLVRAKFLIALEEGNRQANLWGFNLLDFLF